MISFYSFLTLISKSSFSSVDFRHCLSHLFQFVFSICRRIFFEGGIDREFIALANTNNNDLKNLTFVNRPQANKAFRS